MRLDGQVLEITSRPVKLLLAYLALNPGVEHPREDLAALLWPEADPTTARNNLRNVLYKLREALQAGQRHLYADNETVTFDPGVDGRLDVALLQEKRPSGPLSADELMHVVSVYQGRLLPGFNDNWVDVERMRLREAFERKMEALLAQLEAGKRWADLRDWSNHWIAKVEHTPEQAYRGLMSGYAGLGDIVHLEAAYKACASALKKELQDSEWEPAEETQALYERLRQTLKATTGRLGAARPGDAERAAPETPGAGPAADNTTPTPPGLPQPPTPFVGREKELAMIAQRLADPDCRLVTLTGPGGIGKTRLALQAADAQTGRWADGIFFVPLAAVSGEPSAGLVSAIADQIRFVFYGKGPPRQQLVDYLREKQMLLALDNFEHLVESADLLDELLAAAPGLKFLVTSRERLHLHSEWILEIDGLEYPRPSEVTGPEASAALAGPAPDLEAYSAVRLFLQTARRLYSRSSFASELDAIANICQLVEGMPLAVEMSAAWVRVLPCAEIARQIEQTLVLLSKPLPHAPTRQHSVRAVFEHSWNLLSEPERKVFRKLAVFQRGFQKEAAEKVAGAPLALLLSLADKSFIRRNPDGRFEMHELLRQYAAEKLYQATDDAEPPAQVETRLAHYFLEYATLHQHPSARLEAEWDNLAGGMRAAHRHQLWAVVLGYAEALGDAWLARNRLAEARQGYAWSSEAAGALQHPRGLADVLCRWGHACLEQSDYDEAGAHLEQSLQISRELADPGLTAKTLYELGSLAVEKGQLAEAEHQLGECLRLWETLEDERGIAEVLFKQGSVLYYAEKHAQVIESLKRALQIQTRIGDTLGSVRTLRLLANSYVELRFAQPQDIDVLLDQARQHCEQALALCQSLQHEAELAILLRSQASIYKLLDDPASARACAEHSLALLKRRGNRRDQAICLLELSMIDAKLGELALGLERAQASLALCQELGLNFGAVYALAQMGDIHQSLRQTDQACQKWQAALTLAQTFAPPHPQTELLRQRLRQIDCGAK